MGGGRNESERARGGWVETPNTLFIHMGVYSERAGNSADDSEASLVVGISDADGVGGRCWWVNR